MPIFPDDLTPDEDGLVAVGGELNSEILCEAYRKGIFPWYDQEPILWFSPDPRMVLYPQNLKISKRLNRTIHQGKFSTAIDEGPDVFAAVMAACASVERKDQDGTWINGDMRRAYLKLFKEGVAHCVATYKDDELCGGLYGIELNQCFFGESMFSKVPDASKVAFAALCEDLINRKIKIIDCQVHTNHLASLGAVEISRREFLDVIAETQK